MATAATVLLMAATPLALAMQSSGALRGAPPTAAMHVQRRLEEDPLGGAYEHEGCFLDSSEDRVLGHTMKNPDMTPLMCHMHCDDLGAAYMALQYGHECWCSINGRLDYERHGFGEFGECNMFCEGMKSDSDDRVTCGGEYAFDLYKLSWPEASTSEEYIECFADLKTDRVMDDMMIMDDMTPAVCREHCMSLTTKFYGLQYGNECWCGHSDEFVGYETHGTGVCHIECSGDPHVACGGWESFSLFVIADASDDDATTGSYDGDDDEPMGSSASSSSSLASDNDDPISSASPGPL